MKIYFSIIAYGKKWYRQGALSLVFMLANNLFNVLSLAMVIPFLEILFSNEPPAAPATAIDWFSSVSIKAHLNFELLSYAVEVGKFTVLVKFCLFLATAIFLKNLSRYFFAYFVASLEQGIIFTMRKHLFDHLSSLSMGFFTGEKKGKIINVVVTDVQIVQESVVGTLRSIIRDPVTMITFLLTMLFISWKLTLFTLLVLPLTGWFISWVSKSIKRKARMGQEKLGNLIGVVDEFVSGIRIVKSFAKEDYEREKYKVENDYYQGLMVSMKRRMALASPLTEIMSIGVIIAIILFGGKMILDGGGELTPAQFIGFIALFSQFLAPIKTLAGAVSKVQRGVASFQRIDEFLAVESKIKNKKDCISKKEFSTSIEFKDVSFQYEQTTVLDGISFSLKKGESIALVGPSGGGKSTLADMLPRFYDPGSGAVEMDGIDVRDICLKDLRSLFGIVTQEGILFNTSVLANIAYGDVNPDLDRVKEAATIANASEFIEKMAEGYHTEIGERGSRLSGGQRQRLSIARAIYSDPDILILDEATSALDSESERLVQEALTQLTKNRTSLIIAHRLSTIIHVDKILVVDQGKIVESGSHDELVQQDGLYRSLYDLQVRK